MSYEKKFPDWENRIKQASLTTSSATAAAASLGIKYDTYKKYAIKYNCFKKNQSGKGTKKKSNRTIPLEEILSGLHPQYQSNKLRLRLLSENIFNHQCSNCLNTHWMDALIPLELEHIDGDCYNHKKSNLCLLCPNCHALTDTYRGKNKGIK